ncbi:MAG: hypothetical protein JWO58_1539 [Chitinophagaceae bacterium]|nr:hypothetical protein [Chitinophagaceae bacterium]
MIRHILSSLFIVTTIALLLWNKDAVIAHCESLTVAADATEAFSMRVENDSLYQKDKPTFMQVEKINEHELSVQARIGYLLSRGF